MTLERWERRTDLPMAVLAVVFLAVYAGPILESELDDRWLRILWSVNVAIWVVFAVDYVVRVALAEDHLDYVRHHLLDVGLLVLPMLRPLRALRVVLALGRVNRSATVSFRGRAILYVACAVPLIVFVAALAILDAERNAPDANITTFPDALWWGMTTISTVGYGDQFPVTGEGRLIAVGLMLAGIALLGVVTATIASWFLERIGAVEAAEKQTERDLDLVIKSAVAHCVSISATP